MFSARSRARGPTYSTESFYLPVPSMTLSATGYDSGTFGAHQVNVTLVNGGGGTATVVIFDQFGSQRSYTMNSTAPFLMKKAIVARIQITGAGVSVGGALSWPEEVDPSSIEISAPIQVSGTVLTDVGQGTALNPNPTISPTAASESGATYTALANGTTLLFTCGAGVKALVGHLLFVNTTPNTVTVSMYIQGVALAVQFPLFPLNTTIATTASYSAGPEPQNNKVWSAPIYMYPNETLYVVASGISGTGNLNLYWVVWGTPLGT